MSAWIRMIGDEEADPELRAALDLARTPHGTVDNVMRVHSLRPATMRGHVTLYRACLHDPGNSLPTWFQEVIASYVSMLNACDYSLANHWKNAEYLIGNRKRSSQIEAALRADRPEDAFSGAELELLRYARKLTLTPGRMEKADVERLQALGIDDGEILEANQIIGYFNYVNRLLNGLGVTTEGDVIGYYPVD
ncbi:MAG: alkylhydroperoxidase [Alphaproteobacteria bacterium]|nr:MAG: alkylhydroperoxidase [Alphaproteobacteria bacterium]